MMVEDPETAQKLKQQAAEDWELLLLQRAKELAPGKPQEEMWTLVFPLFLLIWFYQEVTEWLVNWMQWLLIFSSQPILPVRFIGYRRYSSFVTLAVFTLKDVLDV